MVGKFKKISTVILIVFAYIILNFTSFVKADQLPAILTIDNPVNLSLQTGTIEINGYALSSNTIQSIDVYVDSKIVGQAIYGVERQDIQQKYAQYPNALNSGFRVNLNTRAYNDGIHEIKIVLNDKISSSIFGILKLDIKNQRTAIMGQTIASKDQMIKDLQQNNNIKDSTYIDSFVSIILDEASIEGVRADLAFAQMMKETNYLKFTGIVKEEQNNFAGLGATGGSVTGASFPDIRTGIRAVIQHLKCYASTSPIKLAIVDPRYGEWLRGKAPYVEWLGINENPNGVGWASDQNYGYDIVNRVNKIISIKVDKPTAKISSFSVPNEVFTDKSVSLSAVATAPHKVLYRYWLGNKDTGEWTIIKDYSESGTFSWTPTKPGRYQVVLHVKDQYSNEGYDDDRGIDLVVTSLAGKIIGTNVGQEFYTNKPAQLTTTATAPNKALYRYWLGNKDTGEWTIIKDYSESGTFSWTPTKPGRYQIVIHVKDQYSNKGYDDDRGININVLPSASITNIIVNSEAYTNTPIQLSAATTSPNKVLYRYWLGNKDTGEWTIIKDYSESRTFNWTPTKPGRYQIVLHVKDQYSNKGYDDDRGVDIVVALPTAKITGVNIGQEFYTNKSAQLITTASGPNKVLYRYWLGNMDTGEWTIIKDYSEIGTFNWTPTKPGRYQIVIHTKDQYSLKGYDDDREININVFPSASITGVNISPEVYTNKPIQLSSTAISPNKALYRYWLGNMDTGEWTIIKDYSEIGTFNWTPTKPGRYQIVIHVKDQYSNKGYDEDKGINIVVKQSKLIVIDPGHNYGGDDGAYGKYPDIIYSERDLNMQMALKLKGELEKLGYSIILTRDENDRSKEDAKTSLQKRANIANNANADLFISLHHDVNSSTSRTGISTHYSTYKPGIDTDGVNPNGNDPNGWYSDVNIDTTPSDAALKSRDLAIKLAAGLSSSLGYNNLNAHDHNLFVTVNTNMPAVLIEEGFLSNQAEAQRCADASEQQKKAQKIAQIINDYFSS
ncbi:N-acetylmuramoyl-L-alanine amidase [Clostridium sp. YIM B02515]|uniref:N-acetylmuramoyl-L-alanine amidase n=1 Tax=Clostridium rhizosphaerae TaxID=2803861 RepID=A0ABS1TAF7_9CLOT|nr:triple tyrosine motif-containing protein [Clostridium rhizosphaerae]MBL4936346.1 N-acetylmuramoyl-L-alanine amidase [Clostridium rhizosphaerae]